MIKRPNMDMIHEQFQIFERPSANNSKDMFEYILNLENYLVKLYNNKYEPDKIRIYLDRMKTELPIEFNPGSVDWMQYDKTREEK